jgi:hypothetical protein
VAQTIESMTRLVNVNRAELNRLIREQNDIKAQGGNYQSYDAYINNAKSSLANSQIILNQLQVNSNTGSVSNAGSSSTAGSSSNIVMTPEEYQSSKEASQGIIIKKTLPTNKPYITGTLGNYVNNANSFQGLGYTDTAQDLARRNEFVASITNNPFLQGKSIEEEKVIGGRNVRVINNEFYLVEESSTGGIYSAELSSQLSGLTNAGIITSGGKNYWAYSKNPETDTQQEVIDAIGGVYDKANAAPPSTVNLSLKKEGDIYSIIGTAITGETAVLGTTTSYEMAVSPFVGAENAWTYVNEGSSAQLNEAKYGMLAAKTKASYDFFNTPADTKALVTSGYGGQVALATSLVDWKTSIADTPIFGATSIDLSGLPNPIKLGISSVNKFFGGSSIDYSSIPTGLGMFGSYASSKGNRDALIGIESYRLVGMGKGLVGGGGTTFSPVGSDLQISFKNTLQNNLNTNAIASLSFTEGQDYTNYATKTAFTYAVEGLGLLGTQGKLVEPKTINGMDYIIGSSKTSNIPFSGFGKSRLPSKFDPTLGIMGSYEIVKKVSDVINVGKNVNLIGGATALAVVSVPLTSAFNIIDFYATQKSRVSEKVNRLDSGFSFPTEVPYNNIFKDSGNYGWVKTRKEKIQELIDKSKYPTLPVINNPFRSINKTPEINENINHVFGEKNINKNEYIRPNEYVNNYDYKYVDEYVNNYDYKYVDEYGYANDFISNNNFKLPKILPFNINFPTIPISGGGGFNWPKQVRGKRVKTAYTPSIFAVATGYRVKNPVKQSLFSGGELRPLIGVKPKPLFKTGIKPLKLKKVKIKKWKGFRI